MSNLFGILDRATLKAIEQSGWRVVPVEATDAMDKAANDGYGHGAHEDWEKVYRLMVAAAPDCLTLYD